MSREAKREAVKAAMSVAEDITSGKLTPEDMDAKVATECRRLFGLVTGPDDPLWELHVGITRQVLGLDGIPVDELAERVAAARRAQQRGRPAAVSSWIERVLAEQATNDDESEPDSECR
ncbi:flagellar hook-length control protein [Mycobacteroides abscessus]|uniref:flagellar hook-length control protein n=1 Tax=Mycobacteroides abscessus TaxID=36809 RepID=UPI0009268C9E|nr:flagellar hook-length control protein [Mycobacteroides abscessus]SHP48224.1 flagellar hook-length control protein [Mycobacteroides abscessus subsp. abscessus]SHP49592.1 flagellar hook-length control protein [Mycobacteroides abscessus subsp. abscessus]SHP68390.1 flagellar hook-length control protein [Mycobacteroides abscessus subsp. abscessus]SHQ24593.1 flagellar hook-length control protein [Mycobacteroides abscessus subsp. abscessus]SHR12127.1 flagellar hook-length control protein [Mycobact